MTRVSPFIFYLPLGLLFWGCDTGPNPIGEWEIENITEQYVENSPVGELFRGLAASSTPDDAEAAGLGEEYNELSSFEKGLVEGIRQKMADELIKKEFEPIARGSYLSFYADSTWACYMYSFYLTGTWTLTADTVVARVDNWTALYTDVLSEEERTIRMVMEGGGSETTFRVLDRPFPGFWGLTYLQGLRQDTVSTYRSPAYNQWRYARMNPRDRVKSHLAYYTWFYKDAIKREDEKVTPNETYHCSPLKFYRNGFVLKSKDEEGMECWRNRFASDEEFEAAYSLLVDAIRKTKYRGDRQRNNFDAKIDMLNAVYQNL